jgi:hypothetical protein
MMEAIQVYPELMGIAGDLIVKAQDWPGAQEIAERMQQAMQNQGGIPPEVQKQMEMAQKQMQQMGQQLQQMQIENASLKTDQANKARELEIDEFKAETDRIKVLGDFAKADEEFKVRKMEQSDETSLRRLEHEAQMDNDEHSRQMTEKEMDIKEKVASKPTPSPNKKKP